MKALSLHSTTTIEVSGARLIPIIQIVSISVASFHPLHGPQWFVLKRVLTAIKSPWIQPPSLRNPSPFRRGLHCKTNRFFL